MELLDKVKEKIRTEVSEIENRTDLTKEEKVEKICIIFGTFCGATAAQPIPFADIFVLTPIQAYMGKKIADIHGYDISEQGATEIFKELAGLVGLGLLSQQLVIGAYKTFIPFLGAITTIPIVFGLTYGMGKVMNYYFKAKVKGEKISKENIREIFKEAKKRGQKMGKEKEEEIKNQNQKRQTERIRKFEELEKQREEASEKTRIALEKFEKLGPLPLKRNENSENKTPPN